MEIIYLSFFAFLAGFIDSIAGGGGLIQLPAAFIFLPHLLPGVLPAAILGTNKFSSCWGTLYATYRYLGHVKINWSILLPASLAAALFSFAGASAVSHISPQNFKYAVFILLVCVFIYVLIKKDFGVSDQVKQLSKLKILFYALATGIIIGFYDGIFGPGTGSILMFLLVSIFGMDFLNASASSKIINLVTNIFSLLWFLTHKEVIFQAAIPMALCNVMGSFFGTKLALKKGSKIVRGFFLIAVLGILIRYLWELLFSNSLS